MGGLFRPARAAKPLLQCELSAHFRGAHHDPRPIRRNPDVLTDTLAVAGKQLIDVGCGNGIWCVTLARHGAQVLGVECQPRAS